MQYTTNTHVHVLLDGSIDIYIRIYIYINQYINIIYVLSTGAMYIPPTVCAGPACFRWSCMHNVGPNDVKCTVIQCNVVIHESAMFYT